jgi:hypothetical protein
MTTKTFTIILWLSCIIATAAKAQSIPNGDFEDWITQGASNLLTSWELSEPGLNCTPLSASQTTSSQSGSYAIFLESGDCVGTGGNIHEGYAISDLFSISVAPNYLTGYYMAIRNNSNPAKIKVFIKKNGVQIGSADFSITASADDYTAFAIPIVYTQIDTPDQAQIQIFSDDIGLATLGNQLWVDHLSFSSSTTGIIYDDNVVSGISIYPNPSNDIIQINGNAELIGVNYDIVDIYGRQVLSGQLHSENNQVSLEGLSRGIYFLRISATSINIVRVVKE